MSIHIHIHRDGTTEDCDPDVLQVLLDKLTHLQAVVNSQGEQIMARLDEQHALLDQINTYTNEMAAAEAEQSAKIQEVSDDLDDLIAQVTDTTVKAKLQAHADTLAAAAAAAKAQSETLTALAAKHERPLPPPVEPEPVEPTPTEPPA